MQLKPADAGNQIRLWYRAEALEVEPIGTGAFDLLAFLVK